MTYDELTKQTKALMKEQDRAYARYGAKISALNEAYIREHEPLRGLKRFQRVKVTLRVTEATRKWMDEKHRMMAKNKAGREYRLEGVFNGWHIGYDGQIKPCFYGEPHYPATDEVVSVELAKEQPEGHCSMCRCHKDGLCYMMGGQDMSPKCAVWKITDDMTVCPKYEEVVDGGLWEYGEKHCPNVTVVRRKGKTSYRVYSLNWNYYTEYGEQEVWRFFAKEPREKKESV